MSKIIQQNGSSVQPDSKKIAIYLTDKCNLKCKHCFIEGSPDNKVFLSWGQVSTTLNHFINQGFSQVEFTGGESCLSPQLIPATKLAKQLGYSVGVNSNGINIHLLNILNPEFVDKITFSLDGASSKTHDFLRGPGVFEKCIKTITASISKGFHTEAIYTVHSLNFHEISQAISLLDDLGVKRLSFNFISNQGTATLNQDLLLPPEKWVEARHIIDSHAPTRQISLRYPLLFVTPEEFNYIKSHTDYFCRLLNPTKTDVYPNGKIYHCCLVTDFSDLAAGYVTDTEVIMDNSKETAFALKYKHLSCPVHEIRKLYASESRLIPLCIYYKNITPLNI